MWFSKIALMVLLTTTWALGSLNPAVTVNTFTVAGSTVTGTTASAHGLVGNDPGFCLLGGPSGYLICGTALTVPTTTTFTFTLAGASACASSCGTVQPGPNFIIAGNPFTGQLGMQGVLGCVWTYTAVPLPISGKTSACSSAIGTATSTISSLSAEINSALAAGTWVENVVQLNIASSDTTAQIEQEFQRIQFAAQLQQAGATQPGRDIGTVCNSGGCNQ